MDVREIMEHVLQRVFASAFHAMAVRIVLMNAQWDVNYMENAMMEFVNVMMDLLVIIASKLNVQMIVLVMVYVIMVNASVHLILLVMIAPESYVLNNVMVMVFVVMEYVNVNQH